ncbi:MAG: hypothetical protein M1818_002030 [Claussenomyces sp. TS43310]|nr:MAG: hypothetical protein M1818_002030 [Claussenomyces sp. TS43310]
MTTMMNVPIDIDKPGKYKVVLSPALRGKQTKEVYTGIRYNHKPDFSSDTETTQLNPSSGNDGNFSLSFSDGDEQYRYAGSRNSGDGQYVLIFDPAEKHFVLHQMDSSFDMNLINAPWDHDADSLRSTYEQLGAVPKTAPGRRKNAAASKGGAKDKATSASASANPAGVEASSEKRRKVEKQQKKKPPPREPTPDAEDEDSDDGLTIEYPGGPPPPRFQSHNVTPLYQTREPSPRGYTDVDAEEDEDRDKDEGQETNRDVDLLALPSPMASGDQKTEEEDDAELDLEAELELALEKETGGAAEESSESEEE